jgi:hypothetical protein
MNILTAINDVRNQLLGELKPWVLFAGVVIAALYLVETFFYNVPHFSADQGTAIASALAIWAGR